MSATQFVWREPRIPRGEPQHPTDSSPFGAKRHRRGEVAARRCLRNANPTCCRRGII